MPKTKELSIDIRQNIIDKHKEGKGYRIISKELNLPLSTVGNIIRKFKNPNEAVASGQPSKLPKTKELSIDICQNIIDKYKEEKSKNPDEAVASGRARKLPKTKELSIDVRQKIIDKHKEGKGYRIISRELDLPLSTVGNVFRKFKNHGEVVANLPRTGRPRKLNEKKSRWVGKKVERNPLITHGEIQTHLSEAGIDVSKDTIRRALKRVGFVSRSPRKVALFKHQHVRSRLKYGKTYEETLQDFLNKLVLPHDVEI